MSVPIYVQVKDQEAVLETVDEIKDKLLHAKQLLHQLYALRTEENKQLQLTKQKVQNIHDRISEVEGALDHE